MRGIWLSNMGTKIPKGWKELKTRGFPTNLQHNKWNSYYFMWNNSKCSKMIIQLMNYPPKFLSAFRVNFHGKRKKWFSVGMTSMATQPKGNKPYFQKVVMGHLWLIMITSFDIVNKHTSLYNISLFSVRDHIWLTDISHG